MKVVAFILAIECIKDIVFPCRDVWKVYRHGSINTSLIKFIVSEIFNLIALIFFIVFLIKY